MIWICAGTYLIALVLVLMFNYGAHMRDDFTATEKDHQ